jgi:hypothetical protein
LQWRAWDVGNIRNVQCLLKKAAGDKKSQSKSESMWAVVIDAIWA